MSTPTPLSPEDDLFGRVAVHNKLVTREQVDECTRVIVDEVAAGRPRRSLASILIGRGYITALAASAVQKAVSDYAAKHFGQVPAAAGLPPEPKPLPGHAPAGMSQRVVRPEKQEKEDQRFKLETPKGTRAGILAVETSRLYAGDAPALEAALHRLLVTGRADLRLDLRRVESVPSVIIGLIGRSAEEAGNSNRDFLLLCSEPAGKMIRLVLGDALRMKIGKPPQDGGLRMRNTP